jgi:hypothetical protein
MQIIVLVVIVMFQFLLPVAHAEEIIIGRVVSLDRAQEKITIVIDSSLEKGGKEDFSLKNSDHTGNAGTPPQISVSTVNSNFPCWIEPGSIVKIWGDFDREAGFIRAKSLSHGEFINGSPDDTGVRRRLKRCGQHRHGRSGHHGSR